MDNSVLVSVIIPCYNVVSYVERAVKSILNQSYTNLEIIIVDDASTDGTLEILENINDSRITLLKFKKNTKKIGAVNEALKLASGNLIALQDADDWSDLKRIEKQVHQFTNDRTFGICFTNYRYAHQLNNPIKAIALTDLELKDEFLKFGSKEYKHLAPTMCATMMITREALIETSGYHPYFA